MCFVFQSILEYNGAAIIAMTGKDCVAIAADRRFGIQAQTVSMNFQKIFQMNDKLFLGLPGLATDVQTVESILNFDLKLYQLTENREIKPQTFMNMVSSLLYRRRFAPYFVEPVIAGLDQKTNKPYIACMDLIGCPMETSDFVVSGTCSEQMYGMCESLWRPDLSADELFETISQALMNAVDRDALSGWGGVVHVIEKDKVTTRTLKARMD